MENTKAGEHTQGEWKVLIGPEGEAYNVQCGKDVFSWIECKGKDKEANALLIASAPKMLEALEVIEKRLKFLGNPVNTCDEYAIIKEAIKSAKGE